MAEPNNTDTRSDDFVITLSPRQLLGLLAFIGFVVAVTRARRRAGRL